jgi:hypothetical protein
MVPLPDTVTEPQSFDKIQEIELPEIVVAEEPVR